MKLTELFDRTVDWNWGQQASAVVANAEIDGKDVEVYFGRKANDAVEINFSANGAFDASGTGSEVAILSAVTQLIVKYVFDNQPRLVWFTAVTREPKRVKLYAAMSKRIGQRIPYDQAVDAHATYVRYLFKKKKDETN